MPRRPCSAGPPACGVSLPGLYKHVSGLDQVRRGIALLAVRELTNAGEQGLADDAVRHPLAAGEPVWAARLISGMSTRSSC